jgi:3-O-methylgallate 3,4-dioxygenase
MAQLVLGLGTSHSPVLNSPVEDFFAHADRDRANPALLDKEGRPTTYDALVAAAPNLDAELAPEAVARKVAACQGAIARLADRLAAAAPDVLIVVGDDQREQFNDDNMPAIHVYWGETIRNDVLPLPETAPAYWRRARQQYHEGEQARDYPVDAALGRHLIEWLVDDDFDVAHSTRLPKPGGEGHAFGFVHHRLMGGRIVPIVPIALNTYYPPNQPTPRRCYALGRSIARAVEAWPVPRRVAIVASGGLSHFTVDEELDCSILGAIHNRSPRHLQTLPRNKLNSGNSEIRNWIAVAGAAEALDVEWMDYVPCYRSPAGTGCGMAFAVWAPAGR